MQGRLHQRVSTAADERPRSSYRALVYQARSDREFLGSGYAPRGRGAVHSILNGRWLSSRNLTFAARRHWSRH